MSSAANAKVVCAVRPACASDEGQLLRWRNDPWVMSLGSLQRGVTAAEHHDWFARTLTGVERELFIVEVNGEPNGMVRYDFTAADEAEISIYLLPPHPGHGLGRQVFYATASELMARRGIRRIVAKVLPGNEASLRYFRRLGFREIPGESSHVLALEGALVPHSRPSLGKAELGAVQEVLASGQIAQGSRVRALERQWAQATGRAGAVAVSSGTSALRLALVALGVNAGDEVVVPAYSCVALLNAVLAVGAAPLLADVEADSWVLSPEDVKRLLTPRTKAIIAVHLFGYPAKIHELCRLGLPVIENCAHGIGGKAGNAAFGRSGTVNVSSFYATKMTAAGEGGIVAGDDEDLLARIRQARDYADQSPNGLHLNDKMTDVEAAIAAVQLDRLHELLAKRAEHAARYTDLLRSLANSGALRLPAECVGRIWYRYVVRLQGRRAEDAVSAMAAYGIRAEQPVWDLRQSTKWERLPNSDQAFASALSLPLYPDLSEEQQSLVCRALKKVLTS